MISVNHPAALLERVGQEPVDLVLMDLNYQLDTTSGMEGLELIPQLAGVEGNFAIVVMTGWATVEIAVEAMKRGASDFIQKPWDNDRLLSVLRTQLQLQRSELQRRRLQQENALLRDQLHNSGHQLIAEAPAMRQLLQQIAQLGPTELNILFRGDHGTGKSLLADQLYRQSNRARQAFISVNMGAIPENLFESEMFGHVKGAFTDAAQDRIGRFELAEGGTLFLDEVANIPLNQQAKLLRVLEEREYEKVGSAYTRTANVRIISATNANLEAMVSEGSFRSDLLYRLNTVELRIPPLAERQEDILPLAEHFIQHYANQYQLTPPRLEQSAAAALQTYPWPGNVRELSHVIERAMFIHTQGKIHRQDLNLKPQETGSPKVDALIDQPQASLAELEASIIRARLKHFQGKVAETARSLGLSRSAFYRRLEKYDL